MFGATDGLRRVGDVVRLHRGGVGLLIGKQPAVGRPPGAIEPVQLLGRGELRNTVAQRVAARPGPA